jgi:hypothetical protein
MNSTLVFGGMRCAYLPCTERISAGLIMELFSQLSAPPSFLLVLNPSKSAGLELVGCFDWRLIIFED